MVWIRSFMRSNLPERPDVFRSIHAIWILALAAMVFSTTLHAQRAVPDSLKFEGIDLANTCYDDIVATPGLV